VVNLDAQVCTKVLEILHGKLSPIISDNITWYAKPIHDLPDEFHLLSCYNGRGRLYFYPFCELIHCDEDMCEVAFCFFERTYQIQPPCTERSSNGYGLQLMRWCMPLAGKKLATLAPLYKGVGIRHGGGPEEPLPICLTH
jgi:hypothetical protein